jgi:cellulose synthase/poly-beta-1,6-N-acetylglucosamine synthase-like glycosyltransferase
VSILIPVKNEGLNLTIMLKILRAVVEVPHEVLVVFDREDDDSIPVIQAMALQYPTIQAVHNTMGAGVLNALRAGIARARGTYVLIFAADEVGPVLAIDDMLALMEQGCEFVSCTRYAHGGRRLGGSVVGGIASRLANWAFCRLSGCRLTDATTGIKMFRPELFEILGLQARPVGWAVAFEMGIKAQLAGLRLGEVPIVSIDRLYGGESTFSFGAWTIEYLRWFVWGLRQSLRLRRDPSRSVMVRIPSATALGGKARM